MSCSKPCMERPQSIPLLASVSPRCRPLPKVPWQMVFHTVPCRVSHIRPACVVSQMPGGVLGNSPEYPTVPRTDSFVQFSSRTQNWPQIPFFLTRRMGSMRYVYLQTSRRQCSTKSCSSRLLLLSPMQSRYGFPQFSYQFWIWCGRSTQNFMSWSCNPIM